MGVNLESGNLNDALLDMLKVSPMTGENQIETDKDGKQDGEMFFVIKSLPKVLLFLIHRFKKTIKGFLKNNDKF